jgi:hypothetical protein
VERHERARVLARELTPRAAVVPAAVVGAAVRDGRLDRARSEVRAALMPQPMSTPTAAGTIARSVGMTLPTVAPMPRCTSGMTATWWWMNGRLAMFRSCARACSSSGTPRTHALIGAPCSSFITS